MKTISPEEIDFSLYGKELGDQPVIMPAWAYADAVEDHFYGEHAVSGINLPWSKTHGNIKLRPGEVTVWGGMNGHGKSLLLNMITMQCILAGEQVCIASMEMKPHITLARMTRQACGGTEPTKEFIHAFHAWTEDKLWMYDQQGTIKPDRMMAVLRYCHSAPFSNGKRVPIKHFVIDSLMKCGIDVDDYNRQKSFVDQLTAYARDTKTHLHLIAHVRKGESEHRVVDKFDIKGASEITDQVDNVFILWRNKKKEEESLKQNASSDIMNQPDALLICSKQRHGDWEGKISLWFHKASQQYVAAEGLGPIQFFEYRRTGGLR